MRGYEADYMIITRKRNALIIAQQLRQMSLLKYTKQYNIKEMKKKWFWQEEEEHLLVLTTIRIPPEMIDQFADENGIMGNL